MTKEFGDARLEELEFLAGLNRLAQDVGPLQLNDPRRDMIASLVQSRFVNDLNFSWHHQQTPGILANAVEVNRLNTLNDIMSGQKQVRIQISHLGRVRLSELRQELQRNRIREGFSILWDKRHLNTDLRIAMLQASITSPLNLAFMDMNGFGDKHVKGARGGAEKGCT